MDKDERITYRFSSMPTLVVVSDKVICERGEQGVLLKSELINYKVVLRDLTLKEVPYSIKNELLNIAFYIVNDVEILDRVKEKKQLPISIICKEFGKPKRYVEEWRDNIITYVIILSDPKYKHIQDYLKVIEDEEKNIDTNALSILKENKEIKGIAIFVKKKQAMILTSMGDFKKIKLTTEARIGEEVEGLPKKTLNEYKFHIAVLLAIFIIITSMTIYRYTQVVSTVMVETTSKIILEVNYFNRIKSVYSRTQRGRELVNNINVLDKSIDDAVFNVIKYANENEMIPQQGIILAVNGKPLKHGTLNKTEDYIYVEQIDFRMNNSGTEQNLY